MKKVIVFLSLLFFTNALYAQSISQKPKIVGYIPNYGDISKTRFTDLTHAIFCFLFANKDGSLQELDQESLDKQAVFMAATEAAGSQRLISLSGWGLSELTQSQEATTNLVSNLVNFCQTYHYDGVDLDWEGLAASSDSAGYGRLMSSLHTALQPLGLKLVATIGFSAYWGQWIPQTALLKADWLQIMVYDATGSWTTSPIGNHSSFKHLLDAEKYWVGRGFTRDKLVMGIPFYGYKFSSPDGGLGESIRYRDIIAQYPDMPDLLNKVPGELLYFNGPDLVRKKCQYLKEKQFGGVMVWEMSYDTIGEKSLFDQIICTYKGAECVIHDVDCDVSDITTGLVAQWDFSGNSTDNIVSGISGVNNAVSTGEDRFGNTSSAYVFGQNSMIDFGAHEAFNLNEFTISAWIYPTKSSRLPQVILQKSTPQMVSYAVFIQNNKLCLKIVSSKDSMQVNITSVQSLQLNRWYHIMLTHDYLNGSRMYIDSKLDNEDDLCIQLFSSPDQNLMLGSLFGTSQFYGSIDDIRIYNKALDICAGDSLFRLAESDPITSVSNDQYLPFVSIFPNPTYGRFNIELNSDYTERAELILINALGQQVYQKVLDGPNSEISCNLSDGVYIAKVNSDRKSYTNKLIIHTGDK